MKTRLGLWAMMIGLGLALAACGSSSSRRSGFEVSGADRPVKIGKPYQIAGVWYYPKDDRSYDQVGVASWYGPGFHGKSTANGERYDMNALTAAHKTLPLPSYVRVTNLSNGRSLVLRVNDRGPFAKSRIIDVSRRAAQLLGFAGKGTERVRVQRVTQDGAPVVPSHRTQVVHAAPESIAPPPSNSVYVQVASLSNLDRALSLLGALTPKSEASVEEVVVDGRRLYRVRMGPYTDITQAEGRLVHVHRAGFPEARIFSAVD